MRSMIAPLLLSLPVLVLPLHGAPAHAQPASPCKWTTHGGDHRDFTCTLVATGKEQTYRFRTMYSGGHDDTRARMEMMLDGRPLVCAEGSKLSLFGEDGDISLECRFSITASAGSRPVLGVVVIWHHAQYTGFELLAD